MNYKDIVKRLKGFDFSKKQKENLANIVSNAGGGGINTFELVVDFDDPPNFKIILDGETFATTINKSSSTLIVAEIESRKLFTKLEDVIYNKRCYIIMNIVTTFNDIKYASPCFCNIFKSGDFEIDIYFTFDTTFKITINNPN